jgi:cytochrome P450
MVLHPEIQRVARVEIDTVIGNYRLPSLTDRANLPYMNALLKEVYRWHPVQPLNGGHVVTRDDDYRGYRIPKGASLHSNNWYYLFIIMPYPRLSSRPTRQGVVP